MKPAKKREARWTMREIEKVLAEIMECGHCDNRHSFSWHLIIALLKQKRKVRK